MFVPYEGPCPRQIRIGKNGIVEITRTSEIKGVTLKMLQWWGSTPMTLEKYKMWHPDHIGQEVVERPGKPPIRYETQKVGGRIYRMRAFPGERSDAGAYGALRFRFGLTWHWHHSREETPTGVVYHASYWVGSKIPVVGWLWNLYLRKFVLPNFLRDFFKHQDEEGENTAKFLPKLYAERADKED